MDFSKQASIKCRVFILHVQYRLIMAMATTVIRSGYIRAALIAAFKGRSLRSEPKRHLLLISMENHG